EQSTIHLVGEPEAIAGEYPETADAWRRDGMRSSLAVPLLREGTPIGALVVRRRQPVPFTDTQIALLETFADQAVIAMENARLFTDLQASNGELTGALEQQTAMAEVLRVIASAPTNLQQVLETILTTAHRLVEVSTGALYVYDGDLLRPAAAAGPHGS